MLISEIVSIVNEKISTSEIADGDYVSTDNMRPHFGGVDTATAHFQGSVTVFRNSDILLSNIRPYFRKTWFATRSGGCNADVICIRADTTKCCPKYLYYQLTTDNFVNDYLKACKGIKMPRGDINRLLAYDIVLPSLTEQLRIADILGSLDEKIEINRRKIKELEALAKLIYDYWFVQFDFPDENGRPFKSSGGKMVWNDTLKREIPDGWEVGDLGTMISRVGTGLNPRNNFVFGGKVRYLTVKNLTESGTIDFTDCDTINEQAKLLVHSRSDITIGDILFASIEPLGRCYLISETPVNWDINESVFTIRPAYGLTSSEYLYHFFRSTRFIREASQQSTGSIFKGIRMSALLCMKVLIPPMSVINTYSYSAKKIILRQSNANTENDNLKEYRDWLLPMLMNGQVEVTE